MINLFEGPGTVPRCIEKASNQLFNLNKQLANRGISIIEPYASSHSSSNVGSTSSQNSISKSKKQANIREQPSSIRKMGYIIAIFSLLILSGVLTDFSLYTIFTKKISIFHNLFLLSYKRLSHFNTGFQKVFSYLNMANGYENVSAASLIVPETKNYLNTFKDYEFKFEELAQNSNMESIREIIIYNKVNVSSISKDFVTRKEKVVLNVALMKMVSKELILLGFDSSEVNTKYYSNHFTLETTNDTLKRKECGLYYVLKKWIV